MADKEEIFEVNFKVYIAHQDPRVPAIDVTTHWKKGETKVLRQSGSLLEIDVVDKEFNLLHTEYFSPYMVKRIVRRETKLD